MQTNQKYLISLKTMNILDLKGKSKKDSNLNNILYHILILNLEVIVLHTLSIVYDRQY